MGMFEFMHQILQALTCFSLTTSQLRQKRLLRPIWRLRILLGAIFFFGKVVVKAKESVNIQFTFCPKNPQK